MNSLDYRKLLNIEDHDSYNKDFFFANIHNRLKNLAENICTNDNSVLSSYCYKDIENSVVQSFYNKIGLIYYKPNYYTSNFSKVLWKLLDENLSIKEFIWRYIIFINLLPRDKGLNKRIVSQDLLKEFLVKSLNNSNLNYVEFKPIDSELSIIFIPDSNKNIDESVITYNLINLDRYPKTLEAFKKCLVQYSSKNPKNASEVAELIRKSLETFIQDFFDLDKSIENTKKIIGSFLKDKKVPVEIRNTIMLFIDKNTDFFNNNSKHHDTTQMKDLEFLLYSTGIVIKYILDLEK